MGRAGARLRVGLEHVVPVVLGGPEALDSWMEGHHGLRHVVADGIGVKAAADAMALADKGTQPVWIGASASGRDAVVLGMESQATDRVDG